ncbi:MAG: ATP-binding cassette domain-containing protein [Acidimicrobiia bacterium]|nr:ATP-binding cassette domain-containing protein [Acidimicrobiia bacterium]MDH5294219.1 ATP-binding cassette domain-containing protein [Acidimicrobiia bacterium]
MSEGAPVVSVDGVTVIKDGNRLIQDVDWTIRAGERWILFGANGSGKTTLMEVVSSYLFPARGSVHLFGHRLGKVDVRKLRPRIGYVGPAPTALVRTTFPSIEIVLTGLHASFVDTRWHTYDEADWERARECLRILHADRLSDRQFGTMSEGEKKRVLIARSLMSRPDLLLLDEPGSGLDLGARERLVDSLAALAASPEQTPVVLVTHHVEEIPPGFDHILMLAGGRVVTSGRIEEVLTSEALSETFDMPLQLERRELRWHAWAPQSG